jgi:biotin carboxyl carrier protein
VLLDASVEGTTLRLEVKEEDGHYLVTLGGRTLVADYVEAGRDLVSLLLDGVSHDVSVSRNGRAYGVVLGADAFEVVFEDAVWGALPVPKAASGATRVTAPMPGKILRLLVGPGDEVAPGQALLVMEAMKMENELRSPHPGRVRELPVGEGQTVETGALLVLLE